MPAAGGEFEELTRGVVHEAYAQPVVFNPQASEIVTQEPPQPIEELPPEEKPAGDNVEWIPGYWSWDDEANHYVWVSGIWRAVPPGSIGVPGYWSTVEGGHQWVSGFWRAEQSEELEYLPEPPASVERGPRAGRRLRQTMFGSRDVGHGWIAATSGVPGTGGLPPRLGLGPRSIRSGRRLATCMSTATGTTRCRVAA
jgi:hypothetical protein